MRARLESKDGEWSRNYFTPCGGRERIRQARNAGSKPKPNGSDQRHLIPKTDSKYMTCLHKTDQVERFCNFSPIKLLLGCRAKPSFYHGRTVVNTRSCVFAKHLTG